MDPITIAAALGGVASMFQKNPYSGLIKDQTRTAKLGGDQYRQYTPQVNQQYASIMQGNLPPQYEAFYQQMMDAINKQFMTGKQNLQGDLAGSGMGSGLMQGILDTYMKGGAQTSSSAALQSMMQRWGAMDQARGSLAGNVNAGAQIGNQAAGTAGNLIGAGQAGMAGQTQGLMQLLQQYGMLEAWKKFNPAKPPGHSGSWGGGGANPNFTLSGAGMGPSTFSTSPPPAPNGWTPTFNPDPLRRY